jgi:ABC-type multidrug transport system fused ATPase/permease subunit
MANSERIRVWPSIRRLLALSGSLQRWLYLAMVLALVDAGATILSSFALARMVDAVLVGDSAGFASALALTTALMGASIPLGLGRTRALGLFSERTMAGLRVRVAERATVMPMAYLESRHTGDLLALVNADLSKVQALLDGSLLTVVSQTVLALGALAALVVISWPLALVSTILIPVMFLVMSRMSTPVAQRSQEMQEELGRTIGVAQDGLAGLMVTRVFGLAGVMDARFREVNQRTLQHGLALTRLRAFVTAGGAAFGVLPFLITFGFGGWLAISGSLTFGRLMAFINMLNHVANPLGSLPPAIASLGEAAGAAQRLFDLLDAPREREGGLAFAPVPGAPVAALRDVAFGYEAEPVLAGVSLTAEAGQTIALVGPSGSGKSTVLKLLLGFYPPDAGTLALQGHDLVEWSLAEARGQMAYMGQEPYLFPISLRENIALGRPDGAVAPTLGEIEQAARLADIHDDIRALPQGYDTLAGERGARFSGGQRQRLALARAIMRDAPLLLLDEPTAALDAESEAQVQAALERFMADRTTLVVAHRLSTIRDAGHILVLDGGRIVEEGTHDELMALGGRYRMLYERQIASDDALAEASSPDAASAAADLGATAGCTVVAGEAAEEEQNG